MAIPTLSLSLFLSPPPSPLPFIPHVPNPAHSQAEQRRDRYRSKYAHLYDKYQIESDA